MTSPNPADEYEVTKVRVDPVPEPDAPDDGELDPADTYTEGDDASEA